MYGRRLTARNYQELLNCRDLPDLISYLKTRTSYSEALQAANPATTHRAQLETLLRLNLFEQYASLCRYEMNIGHDFYRYFIIRSEVQAITTRLQELHAPDGDVSIYTMPDFIKKHSCLNLNAMSMATSFKMLVLALEGTPYAKILQPFADDPDFALENSGLLELEAALDSFDEQPGGADRFHQAFGQEQRGNAVFAAPAERPAGHRRYLPPQERAPR